MYKHFFKRLFDFWVALFFVLLSSPLLVVTAIWLHFANKGAGAWFLQERPGKNGKLFKIIKFKTMTDERDTEGRLLPEYLPLYSSEQARRHEVRLGISGWAQCHGRNRLSWT